VTYLPILPAILLCLALAGGCRVYVIIDDRDSVTVQAGDVTAEVLP